MLIKSIQKSTDIPTYKVYNSKLNQNNALTTVAILPLIKFSPTNWGALLSALLKCQQISYITALGMRTIVTLDMQLCIKAVQITDTFPDLKNKFILRIGELHELFAQCRWKIHRRQWSRHSFYTC